jgi:hypothetical protein
MIIGANRRFAPLSEPTLNPPEPHPNRYDIDDEEPPDHGIGLKKSGKCIRDGLYHAHS